MPDQPKSTPPPPNAFRRDFLDQFNRRDAPPGEAEAVFNGPWRAISGVGNEWGVYRLYDPHEPSVREAWCHDEESALLLACAFPTIGRDPLYIADEEPDPAGFAIRALWGGKLQAVARTPTFDADYAAAMHVLGCVQRNPYSLALFLRAAGAEALEIAGRVLWRGVEPR